MLGGEVGNLLLVAIRGATAVRLGVPSCEGVTGAAESVGSETNRIIV